MLPHRPHTQRRPQNTWKTLKTLGPYLWPKDALGMRVRVVVALLFLAAAKAITVTVPVIFKSAVDMLNHKGVDGLVLLPLGLIVAYGVARTGAMMFTELREIVFIRVAAGAMR